MALVTVTCSVGTTSHYWLSPRAVLDTASGLGIELPVGGIQHGWVTVALNGSPTVLSLQLDNSFLYDVRIESRNAPPIFFDGFNPETGGDLLELLAAQGWVSP